MSLPKASYLLLEPWCEVRSSSAEINGINLIFPSRSLRQHSSDSRCAAANSLTSLLHHIIHCLLMMIRPRRHSPSARRIQCELRPFLTPFINSSCSDIDCYVLSVLTSHLAGHTVWNQCSSLLLTGLHWLLRRLTALTGGAGVDSDKVLISLSLWKPHTM